ATTTHTYRPRWALRAAIALALTCIAWTQARTLTLTPQLHPRAQAMRGATVARPPAVEAAAVCAPPDPRMLTWLLPVAFAVLAVLGAQAGMSRRLLLPPLHIEALTLLQLEQHAAFTRAFYHADIVARFNQLRGELDHIVSTAVSSTVQRTNGPTLATFATLTRHIEDPAKQFDQQIMGTTRPTLDRLQRELQDQRDALSQRVESNEQATEGHATQLADLQKQVQELRDQASIDRKMPSRPPALPGFDREVGPTQLVVVSTKLVCIASVRETVNNFLGELNFSENEGYTIKALSPLPPMKFSVSFSWAVGLATRRVQKALGCLKS
ncbi:unnamed protein product, partial [Prorocentrum cordatum]